MNRFVESGVVRLALPGVIPLKRFEKYNTNNIFRIYAHESVYAYKTKPVSTQKSETQM